MKRKIIENRKDIQIMECENSIGVLNVPEGWETFDKELITFYNSSWTKLHTKLDDIINSMTMRIYNLENFIAFTIVSQLQTVTTNMDSIQAFQQTMIANIQQIETQNLIDDESITKNMNEQSLEIGFLIKKLRHVERGKIDSVKKLVQKKNIGSY